MRTATEPRLRLDVAPVHPETPAHAFLAAFVARAWDDAHRVGVKDSSGARIALQREATARRWFFDTARTDFTSAIGVCDALGLDLAAARDALLRPVGDAAYLDRELGALLEVGW